MSKCPYVHIPMDLDIWTYGQIDIRTFRPIDIRTCCRDAGYDYICTLLFFRRFVRQCFVTLHILFVIIPPVQHQESAAIYQSTGRICTVHQSARGVYSKHQVNRRIDSLTSFNTMSPQQSISQQEEFAQYISQQEESTASTRSIGGSPFNTRSPQ
jgi:hypothetical protein